jgi:hypothetical protein
MAVHLGRSGPEFTQLHGNLEGTKFLMHQLWFRCMGLWVPAPVVRRTSYSPAPGGYAGDRDRKIGKPDFIFVYVWPPYTG